MFQCNICHKIFEREHLYAKHINSKNSCGKYITNVNDSIKKRIYRYD